MRLDHSVLQVERIVLGVYNYIFKVVDLPHQIGCATRFVFFGKVARHATFQILRLAYIDDCSLGVIITIDARGIGHDVDDRHQVVVARIVFSLNHSSWYFK